MLARAGFDVHFLLRSEFSAVAERGLQVDSAVHGTLTLTRCKRMPGRGHAGLRLVAGRRQDHQQRGSGPGDRAAARPGAKVLVLRTVWTSKTACVSCCPTPCICSAVCA
jgi:2-dehydropantoate 2-reductase